MLKKLLFVVLLALASVAQAAVFSLPWGPKPQFIDANGAPMSSGTLLTFAGGSSTPQVSYTDSTGGVANPTTITLNTRGETPNEVWLTGGQTYKFVLKDSAGVTVWTVDNVTGVNDVTSALDEWKAGPAPSFVSITSFTLAGDQTVDFHKGRRLKTTNSGGTVYSTIVASAFAVSTTVTVANDSSVLDSGLSAVSYGIVRAASPSISPDMVARKGTAVASAATTDIWSIAGDYVHVTGSAGPITSFGTAPYAGAQRTVIFDSTPTITHNATSLILPGGANIVTVAGDRAIVRADTTANVIVVDFVRASGLAVINLPRGHISGLSYSNNAGDATNDIDIAAGSARDAADTADMVLSSSITKQSDVVWAVGTGLGGLDTGVVGNNDYYIWLIKRPDTGVVDVLYSLSSTAPTMPANYTLKRLFGWFKRVGGTIVAFHTYETEGGGLELTWDATTLDINLSNTLTTSRRTDAVKVPLNFSTTAHLNVYIADGSAGWAVWIYCPDQSDSAPSVSVAPLTNIAFSTGAGAAAAQLKIRTSSTGTIAARATLATVDTYNVVTVGFTWARRN